MLIFSSVSPDWTWYSFLGSMTREAAGLSAVLAPAPSWVSVFAAFTCETGGRLSVVPTLRLFGLTFGLARAMCVLLARLRPDAVLTHPYEGGHPDHDATCFAVHAGVALLAQSPSGHGTAYPEILEMACYHLDGDGRVARGTFATRSEDEVTRRITGADLERKSAMIGCFRTQQRALNLFDPGVEGFRAAPRYDFTSAPREGGLLYERYSWGMEGERFRHLAREALAALDVESPL